MSIELIRIRDRRKVAWLNETPPPEAEQALRDREYAFERCNDGQLQDPTYIAGLSGVVLTQNASKPLGIARDLESYGRRLLDYDCRIIVRSTAASIRIITNKVNALKLPTAGLPDAEAQLLKAWQTPEGDPPAPYARNFDKTVPWNLIANFIAENPAGPAPSQTLRITIDDLVDPEGKRKKVTLSESEALLLKRAFFDCSDLHLTPLDGGKSGVGVYRACAELAGGLFGQWPQPHFVKVGRRKKVFAEYEVYEGYVDPYVPFHLGPHLIRDRCCLGATEGVIVGDYVEESESLRYCASDGRSASAIACLFDRTLLGWHRQARKENISIAEALDNAFPRCIDPARMAKARNLGAKRDIGDLHNLFRLCTSKPVLAGPIHGDLHASNVRVRATDAIVIDFFAHHRAPLLYDAASLEASLLVEGFGKQDRDIRKWVCSVRALYDRPPLDTEVEPANPKSSSFWFHACVMQIRRYARQWERSPNQYAAALAAALLVKASKDANVPDPEAARRAAAYAFAERILVKAFDTTAAARGKALSAPATQQRAIAS